MNTFAMPYWLWATFFPAPGFQPEESATATRCDASNLSDFPVAKMIARRPLRRTVKYRRSRTHL